MPADAAEKLEPVKSCCAVWKERYSKLEEKRNALRQAVKLLDHQINKLQTENLNLQKAYEEERARAKAEIEAKVKESTVRVGLENEILKLKSEISLLQENVSSRGQDEGEEVTLLRTHVSEGEAERNRLKELLEKEKKRGDLERKKAEVEKKKAAEALKLVKSEKSKAEEEKRVADIERSQAEECRLSLETLRTEVNEARAKLVSERSKTEEMHKKLEAEKHKVNREKKRADSEMAKAEERRKSIDEERKKAMDEKIHSDRLSQQLEEERRRNVALQKEIQEIMSAKKLEKAHPVPSDYGTNAAAANMNLLEKQLKLEKMHVKHAKRVAKLEKVRNDLLQQEIYRLKQDLVQFSCRLNILDGCFSHRIEGIDGSAKIGKSLKLQSSNSKSELSGIKPRQFYCQNENELVNACYTTMDGFDHLGSTLECNVPLFGGSCTKPISGISSELQSVIGGSVRNKSQNSAIYSTSASFSDRPLVGSQGRDVFSVSTSAKLTEENLRQGPTISRLSSEVTKKRRYNENPGVVAENNVRTPVHGKLENRLNSNAHDSIGAVGRAPRHSKKRKRIQDAVESIEYLYSVDKKLLVQIEEKLSALHDILIHKNNMSAAICSQSEGKAIVLGDGSRPVSTSLDDLCAKNNRPIKKRKVPQKQELLLQSVGKADGHKHTDNLDTDVDAKVCLGAVLPPANRYVEPVQACRDETFDDVRSNQEIGICFENMASGDYMKLLELDNAADEERYRIAMEMPLSPTLPEIELPNLEASEINGSKCFVEESFYRGLANEKDNLVQSCSFNVINVEIDSNNFKMSDTFHAPQLHKISSPDISFEELKSNEDGFRIAADAGKTSVHQVPESSAVMEVAKQIPIPGIEDTQVPCTTIDGPTPERISKYCVVFSNTKDKSSISRIIFARETCISRSSMVSQTDWVVQKIMLALVMEQNLLPEEKACVFFSLLLHSFSLVTSVNFRDYLSGDSPPCSDSFATQIRTVISDVETRCMFLELCQVDILLRLIENFLIGKRVLVYNDVPCELLIPCDPGGIILHVGDKTISVSFKTATIDHLVAGSVILASICEAIGHVGFICEVSYNILRTHGSDSYLMLTMLHVFACVCGKKYLTPSNNSLIMTTIKSIVSLLERENESVGTICASYLPSTSENRPEFPPCARCLFSEGAVSVDEVIRLLLGNLQNFSAPGIQHQHVMELVSSSNDQVPSNVEGPELSPEHEDFCGLDMDCGPSCIIFKHGKLATLQSNSVSDRTLCHVNDILSLVELVACYMSWDWTRSKIIPQVLKILESCNSEKFSAPILILLGQLGRHGIDDRGYEQMGVEELRCSLSAILDQNTTGRWGLPTQFATVHALIGLLSLDFGALIQSKQELQVGTSQSGHANLIKNWFSQMSKEQKSLSCSLFQSTDVGKN